MRHSFHNSWLFYTLCTSVSIITPKYIRLRLLLIITIAFPLSAPVTVVATDLFLLVIVFYVKYYIRHCNLSYLLVCQNLHVLCNGTVSVNCQYRISLIFQNYNSNQTLEIMFLHYQKLHLKCYKQMYVKCMLGLCFVFYICVLHLFCTDYQYLY